MTLPAVEAFTPEKTAPNSAEVASDAALQSTQPPPSCDIATTSLEELQARLRQLQELEHRQQMKEQILVLRAKIGRFSEAEGRATIAA